MSANTSAIQALYVAYYNRPADARGLAYWEGVVASQGNATDAVSAAFSASKEYNDTFAGMNNFAIVAQVYQNLFGRSGDLAGVNYWTDLLDQKKLTISNVVTAIAGGAQGSDQTTLNNRTTAAVKFTEALNTTDRILAYEAAGAGKVGQSFLSGVTTDASLTAATSADGLNAVMNQVLSSGPSVTTSLTGGIDTLVGTNANDVFNATEVLNNTDGKYHSSLTSLDSLDGGAGNDTLKVVQSEALTSPNVTVKNVENANFTLGAALTLNTSTWSGLTSANVIQAGGAVDLTVGAATDVTIGTVKGGATKVTGAKTVTITGADTAAKVDILTGSATSSATITGGSDVTISADGTAASTTLATAIVKGATGDVSITSDAVTTVSLANLNVTGKKVDIVNANSNGHALALTLNNVGYDADGAVLAAVNVITDAKATGVTVTTTGSASNVALKAAEATSLTVNGDQALAVALTAAKLAKVTVTGGAGLTADLSGIATVTTVDASASTGANVLKVADTALSVTTGAGNDTVTLSAAQAAKQSINLGAGNDTLVLNSKAVDGAKADGGAGTNTLAVTDGAFLSSNVYSNFQVLEIAGGKAAYDMSTLTGLNAVTITGADLVANADITNAVAGTTLTVNAKASTDTTISKALTFALKTDTGTSDSLSLTLNAKDGDNDGAAKGKAVVADFTANGIESINVASKVVKLDVDKASTPATNEATVASAYVNEITKLSANAVKTLTVTGEAAFKAAVVSPELTKVDATGNTGGVNVDASDAGNVKSITFLGGTGADTYKATAKGDLIIGGSGADIVTLGAGKDTIRFTAATDSTLTLKDTTTPADGVADTASGFDKISSFTSGTDKIELSSSLGLATGDARAAIAAHTAAGTSAAQLQTAIGANGANFFNDGAVNRAIATLFDGTDLYVFADVNKDGNYTAGTDLAIKLMGVNSIVVTDIVFG